ncbi:hypothetical protein DFH09DRAFT_1098219 [Mycena vulgaris]|nr:hypothetical protein DFH09DRAFT_1098219 [Mycena vulgaris]
MSTPSNNKPLESFNYPNIVVLQRVLLGPPKLRGGMERPYDTDVPQVLCYEFRGIGMPPEDIGRPGDIFWDVTFPYIIYFRDLRAWKAWNPRASAGSQLLAEHPCFLDRYLWTRSTGLSWLAQQSLWKAKIDIKQFHPVGDEFQKKLAAILCFSPNFKTLALDISDNRARHEAEVARRHQQGVAVGQAPSIPPSTPLKRKRVEESKETSPSTLLSEMATDMAANRTLQPQLRAETLRTDAQIDVLQTANSRLEHLLQDSKRTREELSAQYTEAQDNIHTLTERLTEAEHRIKKLKKQATKYEEEVRELREFRATVTGLVDGMDIPDRPNS